MQSHIIQKIPIKIQKDTARYFTYDAAMMMKVLSSDIVRGSTFAYPLSSGAEDGRPVTLATNIHRIQWSDSLNMSMHAYTFNKHTGRNGISLDSSPYQNIHVFLTLHRGTNGLHNALK